MSILITGANGIVGKDLVLMLSKRHKIFGIYRTKNSQIKKIKNVKWIKHNLKKKIKKIIPSPKYIIHSAVDQIYKKKNKKKYISSNFKILKNIVNFAKENKVKLIINISSLEVYGEIKKKLLDEKYYPQNPNTYGSIKFLSEKYLNKYDINFINLRIPGVLCEGSRNQLERPWLNAVFNKMKKNELIYVHNLKSKFKNVINTRELTRLTNFLIKKKIIIRDTFNFACKNPLMIKDILTTAKKKLRSKSKIEELKNYNKKTFCISTNKIEKKLGFKIQSTKNILKKHLVNFC